MGYLFYDTYIDAPTLKEQKDQEAEVIARLKKRVLPRKQMIMSGNEFKFKQKQKAQILPSYEYYGYPLNVIMSNRARVDWRKTYQKSLVYFIYDPDQHLIKIGYSGRLAKRFKELQYDSPFIRLIAAEEGSMQDEKTLHKLFNAFKSYGEWFLPERPILFYIDHFAGELEVSRGTIRNYGKELDLEFATNGRQAASVANGAGQ